MKVRIKFKQRIISENVLLASSMIDRMVGLMFRSTPPENSEGLLLVPCNQIHTFFMKYALDVVYLTRRNEIVKIVRNVRPWRMTWIYFRASKTLEFPVGKLPLDVKEGEFLEVENV